MHNHKLKLLITSAVFAALCCIATILIQIPSPMNGYINLGDCIVLCCAFLLPLPHAVAAAGIGSAMADVITGYPYYSPGTLVIKAAMALVAYLIFAAIRHKSELGAMITAGLAAEAVMVTGYFGYAALLLGKGIAAAASIPGNLFQAVVGIVAAVLVYKLLPAKLKLFCAQKEENTRPAQA